MGTSIEAFAKKRAKSSLPPKFRDMVERLDAIAMLWSKPGITPAGVVRHIQAEYDLDRQGARRLAKQGKEWLYRGQLQHADEAKARYVAHLEVMLEALLPELNPRQVLEDITTFGPERTIEVDGKKRTVAAEIEKRTLKNKGMKIDPAVWTIYTNILKEWARVTGARPYGSGSGGHGALVQVNVGQTGRDVADADRSTLVEVLSQSLGQRANAGLPGRTTP